MALAVRGMSRGSTWPVLEGKITIGAGGDKANARAGEAGARPFFTLRRSPGGSAFERHSTFSRRTPLL
jgi:hypothetical protein